MSDPTPPPPTGQPISTEPPRKPWPGWLIALVSLGGIAVFAGLAAGVVGLANLASAGLTDTIGNLAGGDQGAEPVLGDDASPLALEPMDCGGCFASEYVQATLIDRDELLAIGLGTTLYPFEDDASSGQTETAYYQREWGHVGGDPADCFITFPGAPISVGADDESVVDTSQIWYTGTYSDEDQWSSLNQSVRIFPTDDDAVAYMVDLDERIGGCTHYSSGEGDTFWEADVTPAPAVAVPPSVAAVGWVERAPYARYYSFDVQRGNLVVRTALWTDDVAISEVEFRSLIEHVALQVGAFTP